MSIFSSPCTIAQVQAISPLEPLEARMLLCHVTGYTRVQLITQSELYLNDEQLEQLNHLTTQRLAGEPIAYLLGQREFFGLTFKVTPDVLIPRPDTELLVELALERTANAGHLLDLGTGSGAIAIAIAAQDRQIKVNAADISPAALSVAKFNATQLLAANTQIQFHLSDWYSAIPAQKFHTIVSNPPYIVKDDIHLSQGDLRFEPIDALTDHSDGLSAYRKIIDGAPPYLHENAWLLMEHGYDQSDEVQALLKAAGFTDVQSWPDIAGILRVSGGRLGN
ncbi:peptide chain release factor N(5)-glutamine methyltransferase [Undibacterium sp. Di24W]|uniref:peptide chain release factor N(5)-glutamine methyltransferase n=1 Tax=Undibacterium sp. Di24W TaxID=3413033 RepID=UPI003BF2B74C